MKKLLLSFVILCGAISASAQTNPGLPVLITNNTSCDYYITLGTSQVGCIGFSASVTIYVPAAGVAIPTPPIPPNVQYEVAGISDVIGIVPPYAPQIQTPDGSPGWTNTACLPPAIFPACDTGVGCGTAITACWDGTSAAPTIIINY